VKKHKPAKLHLFRDANEGTLYVESTLLRAANRFCAESQVDPSDVDFKQIPDGAKVTIMEQDEEENYHRRTKLARTWVRQNGRGYLAGTDG
jgi:hypothetical protein